MGIKATAPAHVIYNLFQGKYGLDIGGHFTEMLNIRKIAQVFLLSSWWKVLKNKVRL